MAEPDPLDTLGTEIEARIEALTAERQRLSLDALTDDGKARELADVEAALAGADVDLQRLTIARTETARREQAEREQADHDRVQAASDRAAELGAERQKVEARLQRDARTFAGSVAALHVVAGQQAAALTQANHPNAYQTTIPSPGALQRMLAQALRDAGAPTNLLS
jgi:hypothetical protein